MIRHDLCGRLLILTLATCTLAMDSTMSDYSETVDQQNDVLTEPEPVERQKGDKINQTPNQILRKFAKKWKNLDAPKTDREEEERELLSQLSLVQSVSHILNQMKKHYNGATRKWNSLKEHLAALENEFKKIKSEKKSNNDEISKLNLKMKDRTRCEAKQKADKALASMLQSWKDDYHRETIRLEAEIFHTKTREQKWFQYTHRIKHALVRFSSECFVPVEDVETDARQTLDKILRAAKFTYSLVLGVAGGFSAGMAIQGELSKLATGATGFDARNIFTNLLKDGDLVLACAESCFDLSFQKDKDQGQSAFMRRTHLSFGDDLDEEKHWYNRVNVEPKRHMTDDERNAIKKDGFWSGLLKSGVRWLTNNRNQDQLKYNPLQEIQKLLDCFEKLQVKCISRTQLYDVEIRQLKKLRFWLQYAVLHDKTILPGALYFWCRDGDKSPKSQELLSKAEAYTDCDLQRFTFEITNNGKGWKAPPQSGSENSKERTVIEELKRVYDRLKEKKDRILMLRVWAKEITYNTGKIVSGKDKNGEECEEPEQAKKWIIEGFVQMNILNDKLPPTIEDFGGWITEELTDKKFKKEQLDSYKIMFAHASETARAADKKFKEREQQQPYEERRRRNLHFGSPPPEINGLDDPPFSVTFQHDNQTYRGITKEDINSRSYMEQTIKTTRSLQRQLNKCKQRLTQNEKLLEKVKQNEQLLEKLKKCLEKKPALNPNEDKDNAKITGRRRLHRLTKGHLIDRLVREERRLKEPGY